MLPRNIDLTENRDFGDDGEDGLDISLWWDDGELVTPAQWNNSVRFQSFFGKRIHKNEKDSIFTHMDLPFLTGDEGRCTKCGRLLVPWNRFHGFYMECKDEMEKFTPKDIPWRNNAPRIVRSGDRGQGNLFELR